MNVDNACVEPSQEELDACFEPVAPMDVLDSGGLADPLAPPEPDSPLLGNLVRGGGTLLGGLGGILAGAGLIGAAGVALPLIGGLALAAGIAGVGIGIAQMATAGTRTEEEDKAFTGMTETVLDFAGGPGGMVGGTIGALTGDEEGFEEGASFGSKVDSVLDFKGASDKVKTILGK